MNVRPAMLLIVLSSTLPAQAVVEAAAGAARATTTGVPTQKAGKAIGGVFDNLAHALPNSEKAQTGAAGATASRSSGPAPAVAKPGPIPAIPTPKSDVTFEDASGIQEGMEYAEVTKRFGPPSLSLMSASDQETLCYTQKGANFDVTVRGGKVTSVRKTVLSDPATAVNFK